MKRLILLALASVLLAGCADKVGAAENPAVPVVPLAVQATAQTFDGATFSVAPAAQADLASAMPEAKMLAACDNSCIALGIAPSQVALVRLNDPQAVSGKVLSNYLAYEITWPPMPCNVSGPANTKTEGPVPNCTNRMFVDAATGKYLEAVSS